MAGQCLRLRNRAWVERSKGEGKNRGGQKQIYDVDEGARVLLIFAS